MTEKLSLIVQPGDSFFPMVRAIDRAERSINLTVFRMDDPIVHKALVEAKQRGVRVRLLIASSARGWEEKNQKLLKDAKKAGISTKEPAGDSKRARYHYKVMTVDDSTAIIFTFNPTRENLHYTRDFGVELYAPRVASEINRLFDADWDDMPFTPNADSPLLISPFNSRAKMRLLLESAEKSIHIADAKVEDNAMLRILSEKARDGVDVRILGDKGHHSVLPSMIQFRVTPRFKLHAKCVIVDGARAALGSMNLRTESLDRRREVGILIEDPNAVKRLNAVFNSDWEDRAPASQSGETLVGLQTTMPLVHPEPKPESGLVLFSRTDAMDRYTLRQGVNSIGRSPENDVVVENALVSRQHARISLDGNGCRIADLGSGNGTFVNGERVEGTTQLNPGDVIDIGGADEFRLVEL
jgi:phosphatidylserine/phosphatidylglycerophosphate/cardiolipin synthase-like enzyme